MLSSPFASVFPCIRVFSNELAVHIRWPKYWSISINPSNEYWGLIFLKNDCFDLLATQGTFRSLLEHHSLKASILWHSTFFTIKISQPYMTTEKTIAWLYRPLSAESCLCFSTHCPDLSPFSCQEAVASFMAAVTIHSDFRLEPKKRKSVTTSTCPLPWSNGTRCHDLNVCFFFFF